VSLLAITVIAGWLVVLSIGLDVALSSRLDKQVDDVLRVRAQAASAIVEVRGDTVVGVRDSATDSELDSTIWVYAGDRAIKQPAVSGAARRTTARLARSGSGYADQDDRRFYVLPISEGGHRIGSVVAAIDTAPYETTRRLVILGSAVVTVLLLAVAYPVLRLATGRALRPVDSMTRQAADWSVTAPGQRFGTAQQYAELGSLAVTLDELLDRVSGLLRHERQLSAEMSHELRTPLARVMTEVDLAIDGASPGQRTELLAIREHCQSMERIIDTLLASARRELVGSVGRSELDPVFDRVLATHPAIANAPRVITARTGLNLGVDADVVERILAPIVDNALRYAARAVTLDAQRVEGGVAVTVSNDGPPIAASLAEQIFEPGFRADGDQRHDGAGLGLALARRLARYVDGELALDPDAATTTFRLVLPAG
jgi:signal transduction histidine kinase